MRGCMPPGHQRFIEAIEQRSNLVRNFVLNSNNSELLAAYNKCLEANAAFRTRHFQIFTRYFIVAAKKKPESGLNKIGLEVETDAIPLSVLRDTLKGFRQSVRDTEVSTGTGNSK